MRSFGLRRRMAPTMNRTRPSAGRGAPMRRPRARRPMSNMPRRMSPRGRRMTRPGTQDMWGEISDAEMARAAGLQRARENREKALAKLAARRAVQPSVAKRMRYSRPAVRDEKKMIEHAKRFEEAYDTSMPEWVTRRLSVWDDPQTRNRLLKRGGRYALAKYWVDEGFDPSYIMDWAKDNPSLTDKHVKHLQSTFEQLIGAPVTGPRYDGPRKPGLDDTDAEWDEWSDRLWRDAEREAQAMEVKPFDIYGYGNTQRWRRRLQELHN